MFFFSYIWIFLLSSELWAQAKLGSIYTDVAPSTCLTLMSSEGVDTEDYYAAECPGMGGYRIFISGGDLRYNLSPEYQNKSIDGYRTCLMVI